MTDTSTDRPFRLSTGGLTYRWMLQLRLMDEDHYRPFRRIAFLAVITWLPLLILTLISGTCAGNAVEIPFLHDPEPHVRYLVAFPLLVFAGLIIDPYVNGFMLHLRTSGLVTKQEMPDYERAIAQFTRRRDSVWVDVVLILLSVCLVWLIKTRYGFSSQHLNYSNWLFTLAGTEAKISPAGWWLVLVSSPLLLFLLSRWIYRFIIWIGFMNRVSTIRLSLEPTHPDRAGGLGLLTGAQFSFAVIFVTIGAMMSSTIAKEILNSGEVLNDVHFEIFTFIVISAALIIAPLFTFSAPMLEAKRLGLRNYSALAFQLSDAFDDNWIKNKTDDRGQRLVTAVDPSAAADYTAVYETVTEMRIIPMTKRRLAFLLLSLTAPFVPLFLTQFSITEALERLAQALV